MRDTTFQQGERGRQSSKRGRTSEGGRSESIGRPIEGPVFVISTSDISFVQGNTEAHYVTKLFGDAVETHVFAPLSSGLSGVENHSYPFGGVIGVFLLNVVFLPFWLYMARRKQPKVVYCYGNVIVPPFVVRAMTGAVVVHDLQVDPHDQIREFAEKDGASPFLGFLLKGVKLAHRLALPRSDAVITLSELLKKRIHRNYDVPIDNVHVVPLGVDTDAFASVTDRGNTDGPEPTFDQTDRLRIAYIGTIKHYRGLDSVVDGLARLDEKHRRRVQFDIFGAGDEALLLELRERANAAGVKLNYHGHVDHEAIPAALDNCDLAVSPLPELDSYEVSCPAKVFEYLSMGLPIVATRIPPHERHLTHGRDALLVEPDDPTSFADAVERLLREPNTLATMGENARRTALDHDWTERFQRISDVVAEAQTVRGR